MAQADVLYSNAGDHIILWWLADWLCCISSQWDRSSALPLPQLHLRRSDPAQSWPIYCTAAAGLFGQHWNSHYCAKHSKNCHDRNNVREISERGKSFQKVLFHSDEDKHAFLQNGVAEESFTARLGTLTKTVNKVHADFILTFTTDSISIKNHREAGVHLSGSSGFQEQVRPTPLNPHRGLSFMWHFIWRRQTSTSWIIT